MAPFQHTLMRIDRRLCKVGDLKLAVLQVPVNTTLTRRTPLRRYRVGQVDVRNWGGGGKNVGSPTVSNVSALTPHDRAGILGAVRLFER